ncbi:MAG TPA: HAMP domain-containing sensor histidine kinase, partial [Aggregatilineales bacterium]|nr:HAMP domain-containing sensor histidine kinase [Aggregatilineales bacterium]
TTLGQADASGLPFDPEPLNLADLCQELIEDVSLSSGKTHHLIFTTSGACENVVADRRLLRHIVLNLCNNAVKYSPEGTPVHIMLTCDGGLATLAISDEGIGIPEDELTHLFDTFHRGKNVADVPGTGLGLAITKRAVERHGGSISFETQVGHGTTFTVAFPISGQPLA